jgi:hypothetical protein
MHLLEGEITMEGESDSNSNDANVEYEYTKRLKGIHDFQHQESKLGIVGKWIGTGDSSKVNVAYMVILFSVIFLLITLLSNEPNINPNIEKYFDRIWEIFPPIITLSLGYIFGKSGNTEGD